MHAILLLCDFAEELNGKLYIMGGGWDSLTKRQDVSNVALAILLSIPWDQANRPHKMVTKLVTEDGEVFKAGETPVEVEGKVEVGRPVGVKPGSDLRVPLAMRFEGLPLTEGTYSWVVSMDDDPELARTTFRVV